MNTQELIDTFEINEYFEEWEIADIRSDCKYAVVFLKHPLKDIYLRVQGDVKYEEFYSFRLRDTKAHLNCIDIDIKNILHDKEKLDTVIEYAEKITKELK